MIFFFLVIYDKNILMLYFFGDVNVNMFYVFKWLLIDLLFSIEMVFFIIIMFVVLEKMIM